MRSSGTSLNQILILNFSITIFFIIINLITRFISRSPPDLRQASTQTQSRVSRNRPMCMYVLDISTALEGYVTWRTLKNQSLSAPEEIILYSLVLGKGELIMFGGIQKDLNSQLQDDNTVPEIVSNCLHFMTAERFVI